MIFSGGRHFALFLKNARTAFLSHTSVQSSHPLEDGRAGLGGVSESFTIPAFLVTCIEDQFVDCGKPAWRFSLVPSNQAKKLARKHEGSHPGNTSRPFPKYLSACMLSCFTHVQLFVTLWTAALQARILEWVAMPSSRGSS